jgi:predicted Zn-dependent protease
MKALGSSVVLWCLLLVSPALGFECTFTPQEKDLATLSATLTEIEIGQWAVRALKRLHGVLTEGGLVERVNAVADRLRQVVRKRPEMLYTVEVLNTREKGACAYPGGYVVLTKGLTEQAADDHELAMVIAHEFAHIAAGQMDNPLAHELPARLQQRLLESGAIGRGFTAELRNRVCSNIYADEIRKAYELQADERAIVYMFLAGYHPTAAVVILDKISADVTSSCQPSREERKTRIAKQVQGILNRLEQFQAGVRFYVQQDYERAIEAFRIFLSSGYDGHEVYHNLATSYHRLALRVQALPAQLKAKCSIALESETQASGLRTRTVRSFNRQDTFQRYLTEAIKQYKQALEQAPQYAPAATNLACAYLAQEKYGTAQDELQNVLRTHPAYVAAYNNLGVTFLLQGDHPKAVAYLEQAISRNPRYADPYCNLALLWEAAGQTDRARTAWRRYLELGSTGQNTCAQRARAQLGLLEGGEAPGELAEAERQAAPVRPGQLRTAIKQPGREVSIFPGCLGQADPTCPSVQALVDERRGLTLLVEGQVITQVVLASPALQATVKGIRIGYSEYQVWKYYGAPTRLEETPTGRYLVYDHAKLAFTIQEGNVVSWFLFP